MRRRSLSTILFVIFIGTSAAFATGPAPRDVTPEATTAVIERPMPGLSERMRAEGARVTPFAALSRGVCGIRGKTLIVNLPGSPKGAVESVDAILELIPLLVQLMRP